MKKIDSELLKDVFISKGFQVTVNNDTYTAIVPNLTVKELGKFNLELSTYLDNYIEKELKENPKDYNRSGLLYETKLVNNNMFFNW